jgi:hypothetical protein
MVNPTIRETNNLTDKTQRLVAQRILNPAEATGNRNQLDRRWMNARPNRAEVFRLTGEYFSEEEARVMLQEVDKHAWIQAEKAGRDIWAEADPEYPRRAAMKDWFLQHFERWVTCRQQLAGAAFPLRRLRLA